MSMAYVRRTYRVPAKRGMRVEYTGEGPDKPELGTITSARGARLMVRLDNSPRFPLPFHPTWKLRYLPDGGPAVDAHALGEVASMEKRLDMVTLREAFAGARRMASRTHRRTPNWSFAMDLFALGSTYAWALCERMGIDPDAVTATSRPEATP